MSKLCLLLSMVILGSFCFCLSNANIVRQSKGSPKVTPKSRRLQTTTQSDYFFDGSGYGESGFDPNFDDTEGGDDHDDEDDYLGSGMDYKTSHHEPGPTVTTPTTTIRQPIFSTVTQVTVDVEPTDSPESVTFEAIVPKEEAKVHHAAPSEEATTEDPLVDVTSDTTSAVDATSTFAPATTSSEAPSPSSATATSTTESTTASTSTVASTTVATTRTRAATTYVPPAPSTRMSRPARRTTTTTTTTTTTRRPTVTTSFKDNDDDLDGGDDDDVITDLDNNNNNNIHPMPGKGGDEGVSIDRHEEDTNELLSSLPVMYRVSNLPKLGLLSQSGVLAGIIAGSIVVLLCLVLLIMFVVYHIKRKSEPASDRSTRSPVKAGYKKALDKDMYG